MELKFPKSEIPYLGNILHEVRNQELTQEVRLSDGMPDIGRVLATWGMPVIRGKEWRSDGIAASGGVMMWVLYAPEDCSDPRCVEIWIPFQMEWEIRKTDKEGQIRVQPLLRFADARAISARKLMIRSGIAVLAEAVIPVEAHLGYPDKTEPNIQLQKATYPVRLLRHMGEKAFLLDEDLQLPGSAPVPDKLIYYTVQPEITEQRVSADRVVFKGNGNLHILYRSEDGQLHTWDFDLPFSQLGMLEAVCDQDAEANVNLCTTSLELQLNEEGHLRVKCGLLGQYGVTQRVMLEVIQDAYGIGREVAPQTELLDLPAVLENRQEMIIAEQTVPQDANIVVDVCFLPDFPRKRRVGAALELEIPGQFQALYYGEDGLLQSSAARWAGSSHLSAGEDVLVNTTLFPKGKPGATLNGGQMQLKANVVLDIESQAEQGIPIVMGLEVGQTQAEDPFRPSVILRRMSDGGLWQLAKQTGSTVDSIRQANGLQEDAAEGQMLIIPVS